jgi:hypothetical protein
MRSERRGAEMGVERDEGEEGQEESGLGRGGKVGGEGQAKEEDRKISKKRMK